MNKLLVLAVAAAAVASGVTGERALSAEMRALRGNFTGSHEQCLAKGRQSLEAAGLRALDNTRNAAWGEIEALQITITVYCLDDKDTYMIIGAGPHRAPAESLERLVNAVDDNRAR